MNLPGLLGILLFCLTTPVGSVAQVAADLTDLSLEDLMNVEVTSVSKKVQSIVQAPAAVFVITQSDIRRSGVTSIPEALRMAPGLEVAKLDANKWAISARGFNNRFANKLLVLIDGRTVYSPLFSGVYWEQQFTPLEDIDRIEVIRGPGATLWGANAVNGVINIITKRTALTQGGVLTLGGGNEERRFGTFRHGGDLGKRGHYRVYLAGFDRDGGVDANHRDTIDEWGLVQGGFRADTTLASGDSLTVQGDVYRGYAAQTITKLGWTIPDHFHPDGWNLLARWNRVNSRDTTLQCYYDRMTRPDEAVTGILEHTFDLDFQQRFRPDPQQEIVWGLGFRYYHSSEPASAAADFISGLRPPKRTTRLWSGFVQDEFSAADGKTRWIVGTKFEHNDFTGFEYQPSIRVLHAPDERHSLWGALSRAVRTPSVVEDDLLAAVSIDRTTNPPTIYALKGDRDFQSEKLLACEAGYRVRAADNLSLDLAAFYNDYNDLRSIELHPELAAVSTEFIPLAVPALVVPFTPGNRISGTSYGLELAADWHASRRCRVQAAYTYLRTNLTLDPGVTDPFSLLEEGSSPENQLSLRVAWDCSDRINADLWLRYTDGLPSYAALGVGNCWNMDVRLTWKPHRNMEVAVVGQNLLHRDYYQFGPDILSTQATQVQRGVYLKTTWWF